MPPNVGQVGARDLTADRATGLSIVLSFGVKSSRHFRVVSICSCRSESVAVWGHAGTFGLLLSNIFAKFNRLKAAGIWWPSLHRNRLWL